MISGFRPYPDAALVAGRATVSPGTAAGIRRLLVDLGVDPAKLLAFARRRLSYRGESPPGATAARGRR